MRLRPLRGDAGLFDGPVRAFPWWKSGPFVKLTTPPQARVLPAVYALEDRAIVFLANFDRDATHDVAVEIDLDALLPRRQGNTRAGVVWRDIDPGLEPPAATAATAAEIAKTRETLDKAGLDSKEEPLDEDAIGDFLEGTSPEGRARARLRPTGQPLRESGGREGAVNVRRRRMGGPEPSPYCVTHQKPKSVGNQASTREDQMGAV
jgi:hypothetical protein